MNDNFITLGLGRWVIEFVRGKPGKINVLRNGVYNNTFYLDLEKLEWKERESTASRNSDICKCGKYENYDSHTIFKCPICSHRFLKDSFEVECPCCESEILIEELLPEGREQESYLGILYSDISKTLEGCEQCSNFNKTPADCFRPKDSTSRNCKYYSHGYCSLTNGEKFCLPENDYCKNKKDQESISSNFPKHYLGDGEINGSKDIEWLKSILYSDISKTLEGCEQCENFSKKPANCFKPKESTTQTCKNCNYSITSKLGYCDNCGKYNSEHDQEVENIKNEIIRTENHIEQLRKEREENK